MFYSLVSLALFALSGTVSSQESSKQPILLENSGGFQIGGKIIHNPRAPNQTLSCDHGYLEYFIPWAPRKAGIFMWHSASTQIWQNRWDGGEGFKDKFLRRDYPVYLWDAPRLGRANWACEAITTRPDYRDQSNFVAWKFGDSYPNWYPGVQFPTENKTAWQQATSARYQEFDTIENVELQSDVAAFAADSGKVGDGIVYLTNSAAGLRAMLTAIKSETSNIKGIVTYESLGYVFPDNVNITRFLKPPFGPPPGNGSIPFPPINGSNPFPPPKPWNGTGAYSPFGPWVVPLAKFKKLSQVPAIQFVWGDNRPESDYWVEQSRLVAKLINQYGGNAKVVKLAEDEGLRGSTHSPFADLDNEEVAELLVRFLEDLQLDEYVDDERARKKRALLVS